MAVRTEGNTGSRAAGPLSALAGRAAWSVDADLEVIDSDPSDPFDFYLDDYNSQLVAGYHVFTKNSGLIACMPDFGDIGTEKGKVRQ